MKEIFRYMLLLASVILALSCERKEIAEPSIGVGNALVNIKFGYRDFEKVNVETKATLDIIPESRVSNMFVFFFVGEKRVYSHYFDKSQMVASFNDLEEETTEAWIVNQRTETSQSNTNGALRLSVPQCSGAEIYLIANIDADMVNISPEKLNMISTRSELRHFVTTLNQEITSRNGLFPMVGTYAGNSGPATVDVTDKGIFPSGRTSGTISVTLERLDAKVMVNVRVATDNELEVTGGGQTMTQTLKEFKPQSWQVVNLPKGCYLPAHHEGLDAESGYFSTEPVMFETESSIDFSYKKNGKDTTVVSPVHGFSFYMLENHKTAKNSVSSFNERERKNKDSAGKFDVSDGIWTNAPEEGTYMIIKGEVVMNVDVSATAKQQQLSADVTYYVHLGNISDSFDNYNINRNTIYTYTITIKGVNSIQVEVETSQSGDPEDVKETQPGAEGMVYIAKESIYTFDAHYGQRVFCFDADYVDPKAVTWYVRTPFGKEGTPEKIGDVEIPSGMDYDWVHFMVNKVSDSKSYQWKSGSTVNSGELDNYPYSRKNQRYPGDGKPELMDVVQFVDFIRTEKKKQLAGKDCAFRTEFDQDWFDWYNKNNPNAQVKDPNTLVSDGNGNMVRGPWFRDKIYVTVFVDEFYYEKNPITGEEDSQLWKRFVNQPNRIMHVLCDNEKSLDGASSATGSVITIRQRSIQTPYNIDDPNLVSAWGCETEDENADSYLWFYPGESRSSSIGTLAKNFGNTSLYNGLYNTVRIWGCMSGSSWKEVSWDDYLDYDRENDYTNDLGYNIVFLNSDNACLQYSAMMRNRDNNGNGIIDPEEVRWYNASIGQLECMFFGELGLSEEAKLYPRKYSSKEKDDKYVYPSPYNGVPKWAIHIISSTIYAETNHPQVLWGEEGVSISSYRQWGDYAYAVKCVRNLGFKTETLDYFTNDDEAHRPQDLIIVEKPSDSQITTSSVYKFDCSRVNSKSKRFKTSVELEPYDETSEMARLYDGFETGELFKGVSVGINDYYSLRTMLQSGKSPCPDGYRVPNIREAVAIHLLANDSKNWWTPSDVTSPINQSRIYTSTYYSLGRLGNNKNPGADNTPRVSWNTSSPLFGREGNINLNGHKCVYIRCVRDWDPSSK